MGVFFWKNNQCFLRSECTLDECEAGVAGQESYQFDTFTDDSAHRSLGIKSSNEVSSVFGYEQHQHLNCYSGHGGTDLGPDYGLQKDIHDDAACGVACQNNDECSCFVFFWEHNQCFLRSECKLNECEPGVAGQESYQFDTFTEGPVGAPCPCEHGEGKYISYSPPSDIACECTSCDPGYHLVDMYCELA